MRTTLSQGFAVIMVGAALAVPEASAQTPGLRPPAVVSAPPVVSAEVLRHPISGKVRQRLTKVLEKMKSGEHEAAIGELRETLIKYPDSAPYVENLLGVEYVKTDRLDEAIRSFERAVAWLPHDAMTHYNFGLALVCAGNYERATREVQRAVELDPANPGMQARLSALLEHSPEHNRPPAAER